MKSEFVQVDKSIVVDLNISDKAFRLYVYLSSIQEYGGCVSNREISEVLGCSVVHVHNLKKELYDYGLVKSQEQYIGGKQYRNIYTITNV